MTSKSRGRQIVRTAMVAAALSLPALSLLLLGSLWLWQSGYLFYWVGAAFILSSASYAAQTWLIRPQTSAANGSPDPRITADGEPSWTPREIAAWAAVETLAEATDHAELTSQDAIVHLGLRTIELVARNIHPEDQDPLWKFTVPEALALVERVSGELRPFVFENIPLGDQLTVSQVMKIYQWRSAIDVAEKAYDLWRIVRLLNPIAALTNEARERLTRKLYAGVRDELAGRLTRGFVKTVGRAAIDLYGGRLRVMPKVLAQHVSTETGRDHASVEIAEPLRLLVAGQIGVGKSALINALLGDLRATVDVVPATDAFTAYSLVHDGFPHSTLIDSPGVQEDARSLKQIVNEASRSDLVIWVVAANRADRNLDRNALDAISTFFKNMPDRRSPPIIVVATSIDRLPSDTEAGPSRTLSFSDTGGIVRAAQAQIGRDLGVDIETVVPISLVDNAPNTIAPVWQKLSHVLPQARHAHVVRRMRGASGWNWRRLWSQTMKAGLTVRRNW
jgi:uncharacterized protein